jgi:hypothetical protein
MKQTTVWQKVSLDKATFLKRLVLLFAIWLLVSMVLFYERVTHPAFGLQGDLPLHYHITRSFARSFDEGDLLPRWAGLLDGGRGDAWFTFYPPLPYLVSVALMKLLAVDVLTSMKIVTVLILVVAQAAAYCFARTFFNRRGSLCVSLLYVALPAFPLVGLKTCLYANAFALSLVPLSLLGARELLIGERRVRGLVFFALSLSAIVLSHTITTYLCGIAIALMTLVSLSGTGWRGVARLAAAGLLAFTLTAFFLAPQLIEMKWVEVELQVNRHDYHNYFLFAPPRDESSYRQMWSNFNNAVSFMTLAQAGLAFLFCLACAPILRKRGRMAAPVWFGLALAAFALIISSSWFEIIWRYLPGLKFIQFPWRFLPFVSLGCGLVIAAAHASRAGGQSSWQMLKPFQRAGLSLLLVWIAIANIGATWVLTRLDEAAVTSEQVSRLLESPNFPKLTSEESKEFDYQGDWVYVAYTANHPYYRPKEADLDLYPPTSQPGGLTLLSGRGRVVSQKLKIERREFVVESEELVRARIETYHYPHWVARLDGREIKIEVESGSGLMLIDLPAGAHKLDLAFEPRNQIETWARRTSMVIWVLFIGWVISNCATNHRSRILSIVSKWQELRTLVYCLKLVQLVTSKQSERQGE